MYTPFFVANQISLSAAPPWLRGKLRIALASWGRNSPWTRSSIQLEFSSSIKAQTRVLFEKFLRGEIMQPACGVGSHLSFLMITNSPFPILHLAPNLTTYLPFRIPCQAYNPFIFTSSSKIEQFGKYFDLKTLYSKESVL